ncbi:MAG TPA: alpha/beta fold hydrolase [Chloroflexota bacterium]
MKPIVLVHGMYFGGWCWRKVAAPLRAAGHPVYTPSLTGCAERAHLSRPGITIDTFGRDVANLLRYEDLRDVTLVATSCGGMAVARAAELDPERVGRLILVDALIPFAGQSAADTVPSQWAPTWQAGVIAETDGVQMSQSTLERMHAEFGPEDGRLLDEYRTTFPRGPMFETADLRRFWQGPWTATVVWCTRTHNPPEAVQRRAAELLQAEWRPLDSGHYPFFTNADELAAIVAERSV